MHARLPERAAHDRAPGVEVAIGALIAVEQGRGLHPPRPVHDVPRVVVIPVVVGDAPLRRRSDRARRCPGYGVMMWKVAVSMLRETAQSTVRSNTSGPSSSRPKTKLALIMIPRSWTRRMTSS